MLGVVRPAFAGSRVRMSAFWNSHLGLDLQQLLATNTGDKYRGPISREFQVNLGS
jgi:hypothetical protein